MDASQETEALEALRSLTGWIVEQYGANPEFTPELAKALAVLNRNDSAQQELTLNDPERTPP